MSKVENKRKHPENETGDKPPQKKVFTAKNEGVKKTTEGKKDFKKGDGKKDFKTADGKKDFKTGAKTFKKPTGDGSSEKKPFKPYSKGEGKEGNDKKAFKNKDKFDRKAKRVFGAATGSDAVEESEENGILFKQINAKVNRIQNQKTSEEDKARLINEIVSKLSGVLKLIVHKRDGSRAVQACIKNGSEEQREKIYQILLDSKELFDICKSKYGHYAVLRMIKCMKNKSTKDRLFEVLLKNAFYLVTHVEGAKVLDKFVVAYATPHQFNQLKKVFSTQLENAATLKQEETIENIAAKIIDKGNHNALLSKFILSIALPILIPAEREKVIEYLKDKIMDLIDCKEGIKLALNVINYSSAKDKKALVKGLKDHFVEIINSQSSQAFVIIIKLIFSWDDTVQTNKQIIAEIRPQLEEILPTKNGIALFSALFQPKHNALISLENEVKYTTSKKSQEQKLNEVVDSLLDDLISAIPKIPQEQLYKDFSTSRFISGVIRYIFIHKKEQHFNFALEIIDKMIVDAKEHLVNDEKKQKFNDDCLLSHHDSHRIAKGFILFVKEITDESAKNIVLEKINELTAFLLENLPVVFTSRAIYLLVALIESDIQKNKVIESVKKQLTLLKKQGEDNKGATLLKTLLN